MTELFPSGELRDPADALAVETAIVVRRVSAAAVMRGRNCPWAASSMRVAVDRREKTRVELKWLLRSRTCSVI